MLTPADRRRRARRRPLDAHGRGEGAARARRPAADRPCRRAAASAGRRAVRQRQRRPGALRAARLAVVADAAAAPRPARWRESPPRSASARAGFALLGVAPCDAPFLPLDLVARLAAAMARSGAPLAVAESARGLEPMFALWRVDLEATGRGGAGGGRRGPRGLIARLGAARAPRSTGTSLSPTSTRPRSSPPPRRGAAERGATKRAIDRGRGARRRPSDKERGIERGRVSRTGRHGLSDGRHLRARGHDVVVYNRTAAKAQKWVAEHGGASAPTPREAAAGRDIVFACVGNDDDLRSVDARRRRRLRRHGARRGLRRPHDRFGQRRARARRGGGASAASASSTRRSPAGRRAPRTAR